MLSLKRKLSPTLRKAIENNFYSKYRVIVEYRNLKDDLVKKIKYLNGEVLFSIDTINCIAANLSTNCINRLIELPEIKYIILDEYAFLCGRTVLLSNGVSLQSSDNIIKGDYKLSGKGVGIGLVDSGCYPHKDLLYPNNKIKHFIDVINNYTYPYDDNGHGTFISGILCGSGYESKGRYRGVAINSHLVVAKAFDKTGKAFLSSTLFAINEILKCSEDYNIKIICLPFETYTIDSDFLNIYSKLFKVCIDKGITVVVPSGSNLSSENSIKGFAVLKDVITVGGIDTTSASKIYPYSSCGSSKTLAKPDFISAAVDVISLNCNTSYISERNGLKVYPPKLNRHYIDVSGTSVSCAYIAGVCALLYEYNPQLIFKDVYGLLKVSSRLIKEKKYMQGNGVIDLSKILPKKQ